GRLTTLRERRQPVLLRRPALLGCRRRVGDPRLGGDPARTCRVGGRRVGDATLGRAALRSVAVPPDVVGAPADGRLARRPLAPHAGRCAGPDRRTPPRVVRPVLPVRVARLLRTGSRGRPWL